MKAEDLTRSAVETLLRDLLWEICNIPFSAATDSASIDNELRIESSQLAQIQVEVEDRLDVSVDFLTVLRLRQFREIVDYIYDLTLTRKVSGESQ